VSHALTKTQSAAVIRNVEFISVQWITIAHLLLWECFQNRMLRTIFKPKKEEVAGGWRKLHNEELYNLYSSLITRMIKSR